MASQGQNFNQVSYFKETGDEVTQTLAAAFNGVSGCTVSVMGNNISIVRKYRPTWVYIVAVVGFFFFFVGLLALAYTETESMNILVQPDGELTKVMVSGVTAGELLARLNGGMSQLTRGTHSLSAVVNDPEPSGSVKVCPQCAEEVKDAAKVCRFCSYAFE